MKLTDMRDVMLSLQDANDRLGAEDQVIVQFIKSYFEQMFEVEQDDVRFHESRLADDPESLLNSMEASVKRQSRIHEQFWCNHGEFYKPSGTSNNPDHDWSRVESFRVLRTGDGANPQFAFFFLYKDDLVGSRYLRCFFLKVVEGNPRIEHYFF
jgi:hypothetical protein